MKKQKILIFMVVLALIGGSAWALVWLRANQKLGAPGIKATPITGSVRMDFDLPEHVLNFTSERVLEDKTVLDLLPKDTSFAQRRYIAPDGFWVNANIVLMGTDRTSIHKPEFCLPGQGWRIDQKTTANLFIEGRHPHQVQVAKWIITNFIQDTDGRKKEVRGLYVFWFVAGNEETTGHWRRIWWMTRDLLTTGVLQRWAYISYFAVCEPGQEDAAFERMKELIVASVPEFQLEPKPK
ncbi:MAG: exosortase-associated EpsI family protein [Verrucomicrobiota bacterium]|jgi:hypothetical protein